MTALYSRWKSLKTRYKVLAYTLVLFGVFYWHCLDVAKGI